MVKPILSRKQIEWAYDKWCEGYTENEIADALFVSNKTISRALKGKEKIKKPLEYDFSAENRKAIRLLPVKEVKWLEEKNVKCV